MIGFKNIHIYSINTSLINTRLNLPRFIWRILVHHVLPFLKIMSCKLSVTKKVLFVSFQKEAEARISKTSRKSSAACAPKFWSATPEHRIHLCTLKPKCIAQK